MKKLSAILFAFLALGVGAKLLRAGTNYEGQIIQKVSQGTTPWIVQSSSGTSTINVTGSTITVQNSGVPIQVVQTASSTVNAAIIGTVPVTVTTGNVTGSTVTISNVSGSPVEVVQTASSTVNAAQIGTYSIIYVSTTAPVTTVTAVSGSSVQIVEANTLRHAVECESSCTNTDRVFLNLAGGVATNTGYPLEACSSYEPPSGVNTTSSITAIANSGTQTIICVEY